MSLRPVRTTEVTDVVLIWRYKDLLRLDAEIIVGCACIVLRMVEHLRRRHKVSTRVPHSHGISLLRRRYDVEVTDV